MKGVKPPQAFLKAVSVEKSKKPRSVKDSLLSRHNSEGSKSKTHGRTKSSKIMSDRSVSSESSAALSSPRIGRSRKTISKKSHFSRGVHYRTRFDVDAEDNDVRLKGPISA